MKRTRFLSGWREVDLPCPHCGELNGDLSEISGLKFDGDIAETCCGHCGKPFEVCMSVTCEYAVTVTEDVP